MEQRLGMNKKSDIPRKVNGRKRGILCVIVAVLIVFMACIALYNTPANRLARQIDLGQKYLEEENYEQAIVEFDKAIAIDPMSVDAYLGKAEAYIGMGDMEMALQTLEIGYAQTGSESLREKIAEMDALPAQGGARVLEKHESEEQEPEADADTSACMIDFPFELTDITIMGYDLFTDHYEEVCTAFGCPVDTDSSETGVKVDNEYGNLESNVSSGGGSESKALYFMKWVEDGGGYMGYPALDYNVTKMSDDAVVYMSIRSSFDKASDLESCGIYVPAPIGSYEDWCRMLNVQEVKEKANLQESEGGMLKWEFRTKWGPALYSETEGGAALAIELDEWTVGEDSYSGIFSIQRYDESVYNDGAGDTWIYRYSTW